MYPNAAKGVKRIFTAEILMLIASVAMIVALIFGLATIGAVQAESAEGTLGAGIGTLLFIIASSVLAVIGGIMSLVGVYSASKDEGAFKIAFYAAIAQLVVSFVQGIFSSNAVLSSILQTVESILGIVVTVFVIQGIINLANKVGNEAVANKGNTLLWIIVCIYALSAVANLVVAVFGGASATAIASVIAIVAVVLEIVQYVVYLVLLAQAKKMLA